MFAFIADRADFIIAGVQTALTLDMLPTIWTQFRARASTVPLTSSIPTAVGLSVLGLVFFATGLYIATATVLIGSVVWAIVAGQRMVYNRDDGSTSSTPDADPEFRSDDSRLFGSSPAFRATAADGHSCRHYVRAGWCWHRNRAPRRSSRQATGVGVDGDSQGASSSVKKVPDLVQYAPPAALDSSGNRARLEKLASEDPEEYRKRLKSCRCKYPGFVDYLVPPCPIHPVEEELS